MPKQLGRKFGTGTFCTSDGTKKWEYCHNENGTAKWTVRDTTRTVKACSHWQGNKLLSCDFSPP
jgi:hypothetical protein